MNADNLKMRISEMCTHILFDYNGKSCGIDPLSQNEINMWYGDSGYTAKNIEEVMSYPLFNGKSMSDIADYIDIYSI